MKDAMDLSREARVDEAHARVQQIEYDAMQTLVKQARERQARDGGTLDEWLTTILGTYQNRLPEVNPVVALKEENERLKRALASNQTKHICCE